MTDKDMKEEFYQQLSETITTVRKRDAIIVMGDMNANVGPKTKVWNMSWVDKELET